MSEPSFKNGQKVKQVVGAKPLTSGSKKKIRDTMHVLFGHAIRYEWIERNPISSVRQSGKRERAAELIAVGDLSHLLFDVLGSLERVMVFLDFGAGLPGNWPESSGRISTLDSGN